MRFNSAIFVLKEVDMKLRKPLIILLCITALFMVACSEKNDFSGQAKVTFCLEGGSYQNSDRDVVQYYPVGEGSSKIVTPDKLSEKPIEKAGYYIEGWYKTKTGEGENAQYSNKWNFSTDKVDASGVTLYAKWVKNVKFTYSVCYKDAQGQTVVIGEYPVNEGQVFDDYARYAEKRYDGIYTPIGYVDENGAPWDFTFTHPGGESSLDIKVYVDYVEGDFEVVSTAKQLKAAVNKNIYLIADIDMQGEAISFGDYKGIFEGNNHTVSNFKIYYNAGKNYLVENNLHISLFGNASGAKIRNVSFLGVNVSVETALTVTQQIYLAPIAVNATGVELTNVTFVGTYTVEALPDGRTEDEMLIAVTQSAIYQKDASTTESGVSVTFTRKAG